MTSTMYIPLRNISDAANSANNKHSAFGQFMAGEVDVRVIVNEDVHTCTRIWDKFARTSHEFVPDSHSQVSQQTQANGTIRIGY